MAPSVERRQVEVAGTELSYLTAGNAQAPPLLLVHGTFWSRAWQPVLPALGRVARCIAVDFPGFGASAGELSVESATVPALAATVLDAADALGVGTSRRSATTSAVGSPSIWPPPAAGSGRWC